MHDSNAKTASSSSRPSAASAAVDSSSSSFRSRRRSSSGATIADPASVVDRGRSFNAYREGKYLLPNDAAEQDRLDLQHHLWKLVMGGDLSWAPTPGLRGDRGRVLDIGTGTGIWAIEYAELHPEMKVFGTDLSLIQPVKVPPNCAFFREDSEERWVFDEPFDYIHLRAMSTCFADQKGMIGKIFDNLAPGGWVEYQDFSGDMVGEDAAAEAALQASDMMKFANMMVAGAAALGRDVRCARHYKGWLIEAGFLDVVTRQVLAPINSWPQDSKDKEIGHFMAANASEALEGMSIKMLQGAGMSAEEVQAFIPRVRKSVLSRALHAYSPVYIVYGRKPYESEG